MIKIKKNTNLIPDSLQLPLKSLFGCNIPGSAVTTNKRRIEVIRQQQYIDHRNYSSRYKQADTKIALRTIYHDKCAYCERKVEQGHIEHYRPKKIYFWLVYSWDNLLYACSTCNAFKNDSFDINSHQAKFKITVEAMRKIHYSSCDYDKIEYPKMINPEISDPEGKIYFEESGKIESDDDRFKYTINTCKLNRDSLQDLRRKILNIFSRDIQSALVQSKTKEQQCFLLKSIMTKFVRDSQDPDLDFLAFRRYVIHHWFKKIVTEYTTSRWV